MPTKFVDNVTTILENPYLLFVFVGAVLVAISLFAQYNFQTVWMFFLYAVTGTVWQHIEKDLHWINKDSKVFNFAIRIVYHIGNIALFLLLLHYLNFINLY